ncbi:unnamed protein product [Urochloa decumbens]|uniref:Aminotransferase-like plant mobile domain-containing protein n=1 Tax=Urochloa decumbens TaxID=240449 RepID=A0ABC9GG86_9POAL
MRKGANRDKRTGRGRKRSAEGGQDGIRNKRAKYYTTTVRCEPSRICEVMSLLNARQREKVKELGFGCLLDFNMDRQGSRRLIKWLMDHLDPETMVLDLGGTKKLPITEHVVWCVLGLHRGNLDPPLTTEKLNLFSLRKKLGIQETDDIKVTDLMRKIQSGGTDRFTMQCFMMVVLSKLLACDSNLFIRDKVWSMVQSIDNFGDMNWCKFTVDNLKYSASLWNSGMKSYAFGCSALIVMYYLDNLSCKEMMSCVETPRAKFFGNGMIKKLEKADKWRGNDVFPTFGKLNLRTQRGTCYIAEGLDSNRHAISYGDALCDRKGRKAKQQKKLNSHQAQEQQTEEMRQRALSSDDEQASGERDQGDSAVAQDSHGHGLVPICSAPGVAEAVQLSSTFFNELVKDFMAGSSQPELLENRLSKLVSLLAQVRAQVGLESRNSELERQVKDLTEKLHNTQEELEATRATLRVAQAATLEAQSAVASMNSLAMRARAMLTEHSQDLDVGGAKDKEATNNIHNSLVDQVADCRVGAALVQECTIIT